ncbi:MAG: hypothetical protein WBV61_12870 [Rhodanobacteraceae bacterium]
MPDDDIPLSGCIIEEIVMGSKQLVICTLIAGFAIPMLAVAATHDEADVAIAKAHTAIKAAETANAGTEAPGETNTAHNMMAAADGACERGNWTECLIKSENTVADSNLAVARSRQKRAETATAEIAEGLNTLRARMGLPAEVQQ